MKNFPTFVAMKSMFGLACVIITLAFTARQEPESLYPPGYEDVYLGMTRDSFEKARGTYLKKIELAQGKYYLQEGGSADSTIIGALYLFSKGDTLRELIVEFGDDFALQEFMTDYYGPANLPDGEWLFKAENGSEVYIWRYVTRWCIADGKLY